MEETQPSACKGFLVTTERNNEPAHEIWYLSHRQPGKAQTILRIHARSMEGDEEFDQKSDIKPHWMAAHALLKNEIKEDEK